MQVLGIVKLRYLVEFSSNCVSNYERRYKTRFTQNSRTRLFVIGSSNIEYRTMEEIKDIYKINLPRNHSKSSKNVPILVIDQAYIFDRTEIIQSESLPLVYRTFIH